MLTCKWHTLNANCQKFNVAYKRAKHLRKSGENDVDVMKRAQSIYRDEHKRVEFCQEDAWAILKFHPKWDAPEQVDLTGDRVNPIREVNGAGASSETGSRRKGFRSSSRKRPHTHAVGGVENDLDDDDACWIKKEKRLIKYKMRNDFGDEDDEDE
nr:hypothetical protein [Tanacetum cinerariifolium]